MKDLEIEIERSRRAFDRQLKKEAYLFYSVLWGSFLIFLFLLISTAR